MAKFDQPGPGTKAPGPIICYSAVILLAAFVRLYFALHLMPVAAGDSILFLDPFYHFCSTGKLISPLLPIDPAGHARFVWHGPLTPLIYRFLAPGCNLYALYAIRWLAFFIIPAALLSLVRRGALPPIQYLAVSLFCLAAVEKVQFRPESLALPFAVLACWSVAARRPFQEGFFAACAFLCTPVTGILYGVVRILLWDFPKREEIKWLALGIVPVTLLVFWLYPFSFPDWVAGIRAQAAMYAQRGGEGAGSPLKAYLHGIFLYWIRSDFLPLWSLAMATVMAAVSQRRRRYLLALPLFWYFGLRVPATHYNLLPVTIVTLLLGYRLVAPGFRPWIVASLLLSGILGLAELTARDAMSMRDFPGSYEESRAVTEDLLNHKADILTAPSFALFFDPRLTPVVDRNLPDDVEPAWPENTVVLLKAGFEKCPAGLRLRSKPNIHHDIFFNSSSTWAVKVCSHS